MVGNSTRMETECTVREMSKRNVESKMYTQWDTKKHTVPRIPVSPGVVRPAFGKPNGASNIGVSPHRVNVVPQPSTGAGGVPNR